MTPTEIAARLDHATINIAADFAARRLASNGVAIVDLAPGDMTLYKIVITAPQERFGDQFCNRQNEYLMGTSFGPLYPWHGSRMHHDYVTAKWVADGRVWTGVVLTEFLNALADKISTTKERNQ